MTDANGDYTIVLPQAQTGQIETASLAFYNVAGVVDTDLTGVNFVVYDEAGFAALLANAGVTHTNGTATIIGIAQDATRHPVSGATLTLSTMSPTQSYVTVYGDASGTPDTSQTSTTATGLAYFFEVTATDGHPGISYTLSGMTTGGGELVPGYAPYPRSEQIIYAPLIPATPI